MSDGGEFSEKAPVSKQDAWGLDNDGKAIQLSELFGSHKLLVILHNMGKGCPDCALWGDEFNGMLNHLGRASAFAIIGPDDPPTQKAYREKRGWDAALYSAKERNLGSGLAIQHSQLLFVSSREGGGGSRSHLLRIKVTK